MDFCINCELNQACIRKAQLACENAVGVMKKILFAKIGGYRYICELY